MVGRARSREIADVSKLPAAAMQELPPFGIEHSMANKYQSKGRQLPKLMCPTSHAAKNLSLDRAYGFDMWAAISAERPSSAERVALAVGLGSQRAAQQAAPHFADSLPRTLRDPRLRTHVVVELCVGRHGVSFGEGGPHGGVEGGMSLHIGHRIIYIVGVQAAQPRHGREF